VRCGLFIYAATRRPCRTTKGQVSSWPDNTRSPLFPDSFRDERGWIGSVTSAPGSERAPDRVARGQPSQRRAPRGRVRLHPRLDENTAGPGHPTAGWRLPTVRGAPEEGTVTDLEAAWNELQDAKPNGWFVGPTTHEEHRHEWTMYAFDTHERPKAGRRSREWTAVAESELEVVREMARCLRLI
jgi:hypothetical protein